MANPPTNAERFRVERATDEQIATLDRFRTNSAFTLEWREAMNAVLDRLEEQEAEIAELKAKLEAALQSTPAK